MTDRTEIARKGRRLVVPSIPILNRTVVVTGRWIRMAAVHQENWMEGEPVEAPDEFVKTLKAAKVRADIFSFSRRLPETDPRYAYYWEPDNLAVVPLATYEEWWQNRLSRKMRQEVSRAQRLGLTVRVVPWDERLVGEIVSLFARIPMKQGMPFAYYRMDAASVRRDVSPYAERSAFIAAYDGERLVGYLKVVFMGKLASILNIICDESYFERRPANALMAKAVETCCRQGVRYLIYGKFTYGNKTNDSLAEFKRRNGFEKVIIPRYYVPLSLRGRVALRLRLHRRAQEWLPGPAIRFLVKVRAAVYARTEPIRQRWRALRRAGLRRREGAVHGQG